VAATLWAVFVQIAVMNWTLANIPGVCEQEQANFFTCPNGRTFFSSSIGKSSQSLRYDFASLTMS
jgi:hypothetical protein